MAQTPGKFVWHDLMTTDAVASKRFYGELFGWKIEDMDMGPMGVYSLLKLGTQNVGGIMPMDAKHGAPTHWLPYVAVDDCDAAVKRATAHGAKTHVPSTDIPNIGRFAVIEDPQGGAISPFHFTGTDNTASGEGTAGAFGWDELHTPDPDAATKFYQHLFGWEMKVDGAGSEHAYYHFMKGTEARGGMMKRLPQEPVTFWLSYINSDNVDASAERVTRLGGKIYAPPMTMEKVGRFAVCADNLGAPFALFKSAAK